MDNSKKQHDYKKQNKSFIFEMFISYFKPSNYTDSLEYINFETIQKQGTKLVICDLDNTLVPHFVKFPTKRAQEMVKKIKNANLELILISNNTEKRVSHFANILNIDYISNAKKPFTKKIKKLIKERELKNTEVLLIGDMIIMDILAANRLKIDSILVRPILSYNSEGSKLMKWMEENIFKRLERNNLLIDESSTNIALYNDEFQLI